jgi:hypothetical protein
LLIHNLLQSHNYYIDCKTIIIMMCQDCPLFRIFNNFDAYRPRRKGIHENGHLNKVRADELSNYLVNHDLCCLQGISCSSMCSQVLDSCSHVPNVSAVFRGCSAVAACVSRNQTAAHLYLMISARSRVSSCSRMCSQETNICSLIP